MLASSSPWLRCYSVFQKAYIFFQFYLSRAPHTLSQPWYLRFLQFQHEAICDCYRGWTPLCNHIRSVVKLVGDISVLFALCSIAQTTRRQRSQSLFDNGSLLGHRLQLGGALTRTLWPLAVTLLLALIFFPGFGSHFSFDFSPPPPFDIFGLSGLL